LDSLLNFVRLLLNLLQAVIRGVILSHFQKTKQLAASTIIPQWIIIEEVYLNHIIKGSAQDNYILEANYDFL